MEKVYIVKRKGQKEEEKELNTGKEKKILFLGPILLIVRKQYKLAIISILTFFLADIYFYFSANRYLLQKYLNGGWNILN